MVAATGDDSIGEDEERLVVIHEALSFREVRRSWTVFNAKPLIFPDDPARTPRHLGDLVRPKMLDDLVERAGHGIERRKLLDHPIPCRSEEHTSETPVTNAHLVCRLLLEKKNNKTQDRENNDIK